MDHTRVRLPLRVGLPFAALAIGFVGAVLYVPLALQPRTERAEAIQHELAESVQALSALRGEARGLRTQALLAYQAQWDRSIDREQPVRETAAARLRLAEQVNALAPLPRPPEEDAIWRGVHRDLGELERAVDRLLAARAPPAGDPRALQNLVSVGSRLDEQLGALLTRHAAATRDEAARIHLDMRRLSIAYVLLAVVGGVGALLVVLQMVRLLRSYSNAVARRMQELEAFAGQVSHDLRTPLQTIRLAVHTIDKVAQDPSSVRRLAAKATAGVQRLDAMIQDLLQFARSGAATRADERADVQQVLNELLHDLGPHAERAAVALTARADPAVARIAPVALKTILSNLIENAIKYRRQEGGTHVDVTAQARGDEIRVQVEDTGIGISAEALPRVFEPFFRATKRPDSYGLGLATVKRLVEAHEGSISVRSEQGRGTAFVILLPQARRGAAPQPAGRLEHAGDAAGP